jgi:hypothetical protein
MIRMARDYRPAVEDMSELCGLPFAAVKAGLARRRLRQIWPQF